MKPSGSHVIHKVRPDAPERPGLSGNRGLNPNNMKTKPQVSKSVLHCVILILVIEATILTACWQFRGLWFAIKSAAERYENPGGIAKSE